MSNKKCLIKSCDREYGSRGFCHKHYQRWRVNGDPNIVNRILGEDRSKDPMYRTYWGMLSRCRSKREDVRSWYEGRGIKVCDRWSGVNGFSNFKTDMGEKPSKKHSLDRIDNEKGYSPDNCRWATNSQQGINRTIQKNNKSGFKSVSYHKKLCKWQVNIQRNNIQNHLGFYERIEDAISARDKFLDGLEA